MYYLQRIDNRLTIIMIALLAALCIILGRLFYLQINYGDHYLSRGEKNFLRTEIILPQRGTIFDYHGNILATNRPVNHLMWRGTGNRTLSGSQIAMLQHIEKITGTSLDHQPSLFTAINGAEKQYRQIIIAPDITLEQLSKITEHYPDSPNIFIKTAFQRYYPHGSSASHLVGYLSKSMQACAYGQMGLEKICNELLRGQEGMVLKTINSVGSNVTTLRLDEAAAGENIHTTLDLSLQKVTERIFPPDHTGCIIVMDPHTGAIKAIASRPQFNPSLFLRPISTNEWHELQEKKPFLNRALNPYPPGSIFKLITISAALEHGYLDPNQSWDCCGYVPFAGRKYWCHRRWGHGTLNTIQAVAQSCNVLFFEIGKKIDIDLLAQYAAKFGLGQSTGFLFSEPTGVVPSREWKLKNRNDQWWPGETLSVTIGQSFLMATPLQIARMISSIFTGYLIKPRILQKESEEKVPLTIKPATVDFLKESMRFVVTRGTGKRINVVKDVEIYAKTSTAQITAFQKRTISKQFLEHAWFVSYFQYKNYRPLVVVILVENAGTSQVATSVAKEFLLAYKKIAHLM